jgi:hypothetical protein
MTFGDQCRRSPLLLSRHRQDSLKGSGADLRMDLFLRAPDQKNRDCGQTDCERDEHAGR